MRDEPQPKLPLPRARRPEFLVGHGMGALIALEWATQTSVAGLFLCGSGLALGIDDETGTLEVGKRADIVVWTESPFSVYSEARLVFIDGALRHDLDQPQDPWADFEVRQQIPVEGVTR